MSATKSHLDKLERLHYNAALLVSGCIHGSNTVKVLNILNWQTLASRRLERQRAFMYKVVFGISPPFIRSIFDIYRDNRHPNARNTRSQRPFRIPADLSYKSFNSPFFKLMTTWNNLQPETRNLQSLSNFKYKTSFKRYRVQIISTMMIKNNMNRKEEICLNRLRVDFLLPVHLYHHNFQNINPNCTFCNERLSTTHFFIKCRHPNQQTRIQTLLTALDNIAPGLINHYISKTLQNKCNFLLFGDTTFNLDTNCKILTLSAKFIHSSFNN